ncbi:TIGR04255 family protein [Pseudomonas bijieensis]|uniref:TIGR04255 family protein n=1 Tax=Pseudomonas bijieensis TaxID=2681983 RepID=UPI001E34B7B8|nr:TIGR04255 family protein [Pseudomonas bijieensis]MCD9118358.1 TIGR04255 family protein [Pseudomonas bijieensis]
MSAKLENAPVYYALAQVRFNPVALMPKFADEIQDRLRKSGFPVFEIVQSHQIEFGDLTKNPDLKPNVTQTPNWFFTSEDKFNGYVLGTDFFTFQTTNYNTHEEFFSSFCEGLTLLNEFVGLGAISRIGIRYLDAVVPTEGESINEYLHQNILGVDFGLPWSGGSWESVFKTDEGMLVSKVYKTASATLGFPFDLQPRSVVMHERFSFSEGKEHAVIDIDHYAEGSFPPDADTISKLLEKLHASVNKCFNAIATPLAFERWS